MPKTVAPPFQILIDTCVWIDLAKDYQQPPVLAALEALIVDLHRKLTGFCIEN
jgi:hypothetical protein